MTKKVVFPVETEVTTCHTKKVCHIAFYGLKTLNLGYFHWQGDRDDRLPLLIFYAYRISGIYLSFLSHLSQTKFGVNISDFFNNLESEGYISPQETEVKE